MQAVSIQNQNFQGKAIFIKKKYDSPVNKEIEKAVKQLNTMNIIKNNDFNIFIQTHRESLMVTAAKTKRDAEKYGFDYKSPKATSMNTSYFSESIIGTAKAVSLTHLNKLVKIQDEKLNSKQTIVQKIKNLFTKK